MKDYSDEAKLIVFCSRTKIDSDLSVKIDFLLEKSLDWEYIYNECINHKVVPLVYCSLKKYKQDKVPQYILEKFSKFSSMNAFKSLIYVSKLIELNNNLKQQGIEALSFKGPVLASLAYGDIALRTFADLDILIEDINLEKTLEILRKLEYPTPIQMSNVEKSPYLSFPIFHESAEYQKSLDLYDQKSNIALEIHWSLFNKSFSYPINFEQLWLQRVEVELDDDKVSTFCCEDLIIYLCAHASKHCWSNLQWVCDIAELIRSSPKINWDKVQRQASKRGCRRMLYLGLMLAQNLLNVPLPEEVKQRITKEKETQQLVKQVEENLFISANQSINVYLFILRCRERTFDKLNYVIRCLFTPKKKDWHFIKLPKYFHFLYFVIRPYRLLLNWWGT